MKLTAPIPTFQNSYFETRALRVVSTWIMLFVLLGSPLLFANSRGKVIDFEDETIEGLNKRPLDSLSQISEKNKKKKKPHLYRKRVSFRTETEETLQTARFTQ